MTVNTIDLKVVSDRLAIVLQCLRELRCLPSESFGVFTSDFRNPAAAESLLRRSIESLLDLARHLLAKGMGEQALEYRQVAHLAFERGLILDPELARRFKLIAGFRNRLTHFYAEVTPEELYRIVRDELEDIERIAEELKQAAVRLGGAQD